MVGVVFGGEGMSNLFARVRGRDLPVASFSLTIKQNSIGDAKLTVPLAPLVNAGEEYVDTIRALTLDSFAVYHKGRLLRSGIIKDARFAEFNGVPGFVEMNCEDEFGRLRNIWAKPDAQYQNRNALDVVNDLLRLAPDWHLDDTRSYSATNVTLNARDKESLWAQLVATSEQTGNLYLRYGGFNYPTQKHLLDFGSFNTENSHVYAVQGVNLISLKSERKPFRPVKRLRPLGGDLDNGDPLELDGTETVEAGFPVVLDSGTGKYYIENTTVTRGIDLVETYNEVEPKDSPTSGQLAEARNALYQRALRDMKNSTATEIMTVECVLPELPQISDAITISSAIEEPIVDSFTEKARWRTVRRINGLYRIVQIQVDFKDGASPVVPPDTALQQTDGLVVKLQATDAQDLPNYDPVKRVAKKLRRRKKKGVAPLTLLGFSQFTVTHTAQFPDYEAFEGYKAKQFTFTDPAPPGGADYVRWRVFNASLRTARWEIVSIPAAPGDPLVLGVSGPNGTDWDTRLSVSVSVQFRYYDL